MSLLINTLTLALGIALTAGLHFSHAISHDTHCFCTRTHIEAPVGVPCGCLYTSLSSWEWVCLENMSSADARRLFSCQKILFTFHFYTAPQPHSGALFISALLPKTCTLCICAFPLSISLTDSNQLVDLRADLNKYTLSVVSTS